MDASRYAAALHDHLASVSALADEPTKEVVQQLGTSVESAFQLALLQALTDAAAQLSAELSPLAVQVRLDGTDPEFMVQRPPGGDAAAGSAEGVDFDLVDYADLREEDDEDDFLGAADQGPARISLRLPAVVKRRIDQAADEEQVSTNAWIVRAVISQLPQLPRRPRSDRQERRGRRGQRRGGWNDAFGPGGPHHGGHGGPFGGTPPPR